MTPELEQQITALIQAARSTGTEVSSFIAQQAPDVIEQMLKWKMMANCLEAVVWLGLATLLGYIGHIIWKKEREERDTHIGSIVLWAFAGTFALFSLPSAFMALKVHTAPKVVVMEWVAEQVKSVKP